jgi:hypothetical protein
MKLVRNRKHLSNRKEWGCPLTKNRSNWCYKMCAPKDGIGYCGRVAAHGILGRTQSAILAHKAAQQS